MENVKKGEHGSKSMVKKNVAMCLFLILAIFSLAFAANQPGMEIPPG
jgi:hypothetical protein